MRRYVIRTALVCLLAHGISIATAQPPNDTCGEGGTAFAIPGLGGAISQSVEGWTADGLDCGGVAGADVYFSFVPAWSGAWQIDLCHRETDWPVFDGVLSVLTGCESDATVIACADDACGLQARLASVSLIAGRSYVVRVGRKTGLASALIRLVVGRLAVLEPAGACCSMGACSIRLSGDCTSAGGVFLGGGSVCRSDPCGTHPANDVCGEGGGLYLVPGIGGQIAQTASGWRSEGEVCVGSGADVFFSFVPASAGPWHFDLCQGFLTDLVLSVHRGGCPIGAPLACEDDSCGPLPAITSLTLEPGALHTIRVGRFSGSSRSTFALTVLDLTTALGACCEGGACRLVFPRECGGQFGESGTSCNPNPCVAPAGDVCSDAVPIADESSLSGASIGASGADITSCALDDTRDVWYRFTAPRAAIYQFQTHGEFGMDTTLAAFSGCDPGSTQLACDDDGGGGLLSLIRVPMVADQLVRVRVAGYRGASGRFELSVRDRTSLGACCRGAICLIASRDTCGANSAFAFGVPCNASGDWSQPCCIADFDRTSATEVGTPDDLLAYLAAFFGGSAQADTNGGGLSLQDLLDYLSAYFAGCG